MAGCRKLTQEEIRQVDSLLTRTRDKVLFKFGLLTGFRVSEILSVKVNQVFQHDKMVDRVRIKRSDMKGNVTREVVLSESLKLSIMTLIQEQGLSNDDYLFKSRKGKNQAIGRIQAWKVLSDAFDQARMIGSLGTHVMRKSFAANVHQALKFDIVKTQRALGHRSILSTIKYLPVDEKEVDDSILSLDML